MAASTATAVFGAAFCGAVLSVVLDITETWAKPAPQGKGHFPAQGPKPGTVAMSCSRS